MSQSLAPSIIAGTGVLEPAYGSPQLHVDARREGDAASGGFFIHYPTGCRLQGSIVCTWVVGATAAALGRIERRELGNDPRCELFHQDEYVQIGLLDTDAALGWDLANFSPSRPHRLACEGIFDEAKPELPVVEGNFVVIDRQ